jgi:hypothetical protein
MTLMRESPILWGPGIGGEVQLVQAALVLVSVLRLAASARPLYRLQRTRTPLEDVLDGSVEPEFLAMCALASRLPSDDIHYDGGNGMFDGGRGALPVLRVLMLADNRFCYLWERCRADVDSARRASPLVFLLSLVALAYSAFPLYFLHFNNSRQGGLTSLFWALKDLLALLGFGWLCCALLYLTSSFFERALVKRRISWVYFCGRLKSGLSRSPTVS